MSSHDHLNKTATNFYDDDSNRKEPRSSAEGWETLDQVATSSSQVINPNRPSPDAYRQPQSDTSTPPEESPSRLRTLWENRKFRVGAGIGAAVLTAGIISLGIAKATSNDNDPALYENDRATVDTQPQDENTIQEPTPSESAVETFIPPTEEYEQFTNETAAINLEGIASKEDMTHAVVEFMSNHMMAGATTANFEAWKASGESASVFSANIAHGNRLAVEAAHPGLSGIDATYLDQAEALNATALEAFFQSMDGGIRPFHAEFVYKDAEDIENIDKGPILGTTITTTLEINGMTVVDTNDEPLEYTFKTNAWAVDAEGATIWDIENNTESGSLTIGSIRPDSLPEASTLTRGA